MNVPPKNSTRRNFLGTVGLAAAASPWLTGCAGTRRIREDHSIGNELSADLVIIGGGLGGCSAALAAARNGLRILMTEETDWIGGQLTQQAVPPDENKWIETFGSSASYAALRKGIRDYYKRNYPVTEKARAWERLNPGNCWVSLIGCEPRVGLAVLHEMLAPYLSDGRIRILLNHLPVSAEVNGDKVSAICVLDKIAGDKVWLRAPFFADATEQGDLLPMTGTEFNLGAEARAQTGEPHAKEVAQPDNLQGFTMCFAMDHLEGEDHTSSRPENYSRWRELTMRGQGQSTHHFLSFEDQDSKKIGFDPIARKGYWTYRRVVDHNLFTPGTFQSDVTIVNWAQNDYSFGRICGVGKREAQMHIKSAKQLSLSLLYWLQTEAPRPDGGTGWKGLRLRPDIVGTEDGLAKYPYIREGRRIQAEFTVLEQHVTTAARMHETSLSHDEVRATQFPDSVGIGSYHMDIHLTTRGDRGQFGSTLPFQIPLGALIPKRMENLIPACKNIGVTHLTNGCYRLHPVEWGVGEAAGSLAAFCLAQKRAPREVRNKAGHLSDYQALLRKDGVRLEWPKEAGAI